MDSVPWGMQELCCVAAEVLEKDPGPSSRPASAGPALACLQLWQAVATQRKQGDQEGSAEGAAEAEQKEGE